MLGVNLTLCCLAYSLQHCTAFTPTLCCLVYSLQHWSNFKRDCTSFHTTSVISVLCIYMITIYSSHYFAPYSVMHSTHPMAYRSTWFVLMSYWRARHALPFIIVLVGLVSPLIHLILVIRCRL